jgi:hypothetical protein
MKRTVSQPDQAAPRFTVADIQTGGWREGVDISTVSPPVPAPGALLLAGTGAVTLASIRRCALLRGLSTPSPQRSQGPQASVLWPPFSSWEKTEVRSKRTGRLPLRLAFPRNFPKGTSRKLPT